MTCPECHGHLTVKDSRPSTLHALPVIRRRRHCDSCKGRFTTYELTLDHLEHMMPPSMPIAARSALRTFLDAHKDSP